MTDTRSKAQKEFENNLNHEKHIERLQKWIGVPEAEVTRLHISKIPKKFRKYAKVNHPDRWIFAEERTAEQIAAHDKEWREINAAKDFLANQFQPFLKRFPTPGKQILFEEEKRRRKEEQERKEKERKELEAKRKRDEERNRIENKRRHEEQLRIENEKREKKAREQAYLKEQAERAAAEQKRMDEEKSLLERMMDPVQRLRDEIAAASSERKKEKLKAAAEKRRLEKQNKRGKQVFAKRNEKGGYVDNTIRRRTKMKFERFTFNIDVRGETTVQLYFQKPEGFQLDVWEVEVKCCDFNQIVFKKRKNKVKYVLEGLLPGREYTITAFPRVREWSLRNSHPGETRVIKTPGTYKPGLHPHIQTNQEVKQVHDFQRAQEKQKEERAKQEIRAEAQERRSHGVARYSEKYAEWQHEKAQLLASEQSHEAQLQIMKRDQDLYDKCLDVRSLELEAWQRRLVSKGYDATCAYYSCIGSQSFEEAERECLIRVGNQTPSPFMADNSDVKPSGHELETRMSPEQSDLDMSHLQKKRMPPKRKHMRKNKSASSISSSPVSSSGKPRHPKRTHKRNSNSAKSSPFDTFAEKKQKTSKKRLLSSKSSPFAETKEPYPTFSSIDAEKKKRKTSSGMQKVKVSQKEVIQHKNQRGTRRRRGRGRGINPPGLGRGANTTASRNLNVSSPREANKSFGKNVIQPFQAHVGTSPQPREQIDFGASRSRSPRRFGEPSVSAIRGEPSISIVREPPLARGEAHFVNSTQVPGYVANPQPLGPGFFSQQNAQANYESPSSVHILAQKNDVPPMEWSVDEVVQWVRKGGFVRQANLFEEHEIDGEALLELEENDLQEIGFKLGPRKKFMKALRQLA